MGTKSRGTIYGASIRAAAARAIIWSKSEYNDLIHTYLAQL
jgi:hypothetical protein